MKNDSLDRREFLKKASAAGVVTLSVARGSGEMFGPSFAYEGSPNEKMVVGVMGLNGRGMVHAQDFAHGAQHDASDISATSIPMFSRRR